MEPGTYFIRKEPPDDYVPEIIIRTLSDKVVTIKLIALNYLTRATDAEVAQHEAEAIAMAEIIAKM